MAIRTAYALHTDYPEQLVETVEIPTGETYKVGDAIVAEVLNTNSNKVYLGSQVSDVTTERPLMIIDQKFVELASGLRLDGASLLTDLEFHEGDVITAIRPLVDMKYEFAQDNLANTGVVIPAVGVFIVPVAGGNQWATSATIGTALVAYKIEALATIPTGGNMALGYSASVITRCVKA